MKLCLAEIRTNHLPDNGWMRYVLRFRGWFSPLLQCSWTFEEMLTDLFLVLNKNNKKKGETKRGRLTCMINLR